MTVIMIRLVIVYVFLTFTVRFMGKRQIGEMQMSELITAFILSELAAMPITDTGIPLLFSLIPIMLVAIMEILISYAFLRSRKLARMVTGSPQVLIRDGIIDAKALLSCRMTIAELMGELRLQGTPSPADIAYAILEENGRISVIPKAMMMPPDAQSVGISTEERGICHTLISDGVISRTGLTLSGYSETDLYNELTKRRIGSERDVFLLTVDDCGNWFVQKKETES